MIKHIVIYKLKDQSSETINTLKKNFLSMQGKIEGLISVSCGADVLHSERSFHFALICEFSDKASLEAYKTHPVHLPVKEYVHTVITESKSVDYEF